MSKVDLSQLPAPEIVEVPTFEEILSTMKSQALDYCPDLTEALEIESEPATAVLEACAYYHLACLQAVNDAGKQCMLAYATGSNLEGLGALFDEARDGDDDETYRRRIQLAFDGLSTAGSTKMYRYWALTTSLEWIDLDGLEWVQKCDDAYVYREDDSHVVRVAVLGGSEQHLVDESLNQSGFAWGIRCLNYGGVDVGATSLSCSPLPVGLPVGKYYFADGGCFELTSEAEAGDIDLTGTCLKEIGEGAEGGLIYAVEQILDEDEVRPLSDDVVVEAAELQVVNVLAEVEVSGGPSPSLVQSCCVDEITSYLSSCEGFDQKVSVDVIRGRLAMVDGVVGLTVSSPESDIIVGGPVAIKMGTVEVTAV